MPSMELDAIDIRILHELQSDGGMSNADLADHVGLSPSPCLRRVKLLSDAGILKRRVALLDPHKVNAGVTVFVSISTSQHTQDWLDRFHDVIREFPEVVEFYRMSGQVDYLLRVVVPDIEHYDDFYKRLIAQIELTDVSSSFAMEQIKFTTELPLDYAEEKAAAE